DRVHGSRRAACVPRSGEAHADDRRREGRDPAGLVERRLAHRVRGEAGAEEVPTRLVYHHEVMDFRPTDEQALLRRTVREFAETEIRPHVREWDHDQHFPTEL